MIFSFMIDKGYVTYYLDVNSKLETMGRSAYEEDLAHGASMPSWDDCGSITLDYFERMLKGLTEYSLIGVTNE